MTSRRQFIKNNTALMGGIAFFPGEVLLQKKKTNAVFGLQLYSVREDMAKDPIGTLKKVAEMGYTVVGNSNYENGKFYGYSPKEFRKILKDLGLSIPTGHSPLWLKDWIESRKDFTDAWKKTIDDAATVGLKYVISPAWLEDKPTTSLSRVKELMEVFNKCGEMCLARGVKFGYHNHNVEFLTQVGDQTLYDAILQNTDPSLVFHQIDIGHMYGANYPHQKLLKKYPGRFETMHLKDIVPSTTSSRKYDSIVLEDGTVPLKKAVKSFLKKGGTRYFIIEQEAYHGKTPLQCMEENFAVVNDWNIF